MIIQRSETKKGKMQRRCVLNCNDKFCNSSFFVHSVISFISEKQCWEEQPGSYFRELKKQFFWVKILKFFNVDPGSGMEKNLDPGWKKVGSGIQDKHSGSATLLKRNQRVKERTWGYCCCWPGRPSMLLMLATAATALASGLSHTYCYRIELTACQSFFKLSPKNRFILLFTFFHHAIETGTAELFPFREALSQQ